MTMKTTMRSGLALGLIISAALAACSRADRGDSRDTTMASSGGAVDSTGNTNTASSGSVADEVVLRTVSAIDRGEVEAGRLAKSKATNAAVRNYANMMISDHGAMARQDSQVASRLHIEVGSSTAGGAATAGDSARSGTSGTLPTGTPAAGTAGTSPGTTGGDVSAQVEQMNQQTMQRLRSAKKGAEFDRAYIESMVQGHQAALQQLRQFDSGTRNQDLKNLVQNVTPKVQEHLDLAQEIQQKLGSEGQGPAQQ
jgi:putative membrane protein